MPATGGLAALKKCQMPGALFSGKAPGDLLSESIVNQSIVNTVLIKLRVMKLKSKKTLTGAALLLSLLSSMNAAIIVVTSDITSNTNWVNTNEYVLQGSTANQGAIRVLPGATLTIQQGTIIRGQPRTDASTYDAGSLGVLRGGQIIARGTAVNPIVFTTAAVDNNSDGYPDGFTRNGLPGSGASAAVFADRYNPSGFVQFWDNAPKTVPQNITVTGLWGGVVVTGRAPVNYAAVTADDTVDPTPKQDGTITPTPYVYTKPILEGFTSPDYEYGSDWRPTDILPTGTSGSYVRRNYIDTDDSSGALSYISIRHGGIQLSANNEINGLTLAGVGRGTQVDHIEIWGNEDDGIEIFGGSVNLSYVSIISTKDDGLDIDQGYTGQIQYALVVGGSYADKLLEWDGDDANDSGRAAKANFENRGNWEARNLTLIGGPTVNGGSGAGKGAHIRNNASQKLYNSIFANISGSLDSITAETKFWNVISNVTYASANAINTTNAPEAVAYALDTDTPDFDAFTFAVSSIAGDTTGLQAPTSINPVPDQTGSAVSVFDYEVPASGNILPRGFFDNVDYRGAFQPGVTVLWTDGWTAADASGVVHP